MSTLTAEHGEKKGYRKDLRNSEPPVRNTGTAGMDCSLEGRLLLLQDHLSQLLLDHAAGYRTCRGTDMRRLATGREEAS